ncbi:MAG: HypC/HybG/HupF family hydrogenase formation chaperone [Austwickia sp.]|jgi:hydrogenase maturation factor|nr:MAG: HypC/HybG/HupF family hydrogenase formation chaperone [Austwickia sp.]
MTGDGRDEAGETTCVTCSDEGRPGVILALPADARPGEPALVRTDRGEERVDLCLVDGVRTGDVVLIHAGLAIAVLPAAERPVGTPA